MPNKSPGSGDRENQQSLHRRRPWPWLIALAIPTFIGAAADNWLPYALISHGNIAVTQSLLPDWEQLLFVAPDGVALDGWFIPAPATPLEVLPRGNEAAAAAETRAIAAAPPPITLILLHGLGANRMALLDFGLALQTEAQQRGLPLNLVLVDLRSHGKSGGDYFTYGDREDEDISALLDTLDAQLPNPSYAILGLSAGGAVATAAAAEDPRLQALITIGTFASLEQTAQAQVSWLPGPWRDRIFRRAEAIAQFKVARTAPAQWISQVACPVFIAHGQTDGYIPFSDAEQLYQQAREPKQLYAIPNADHADMLTTGGEPLRHEIIEFLQRAII